MTVDVMTITIAFICIFLFFIYNSKTQKGRSIPGPKGYPLFGNLFQVRTKPLHLILNDWAKEYGEIFQFSMYGRRMISINSSDVIRQIFTQDPFSTITAARPVTFMAKYYSNFGDVFFPSIGDRMILRRKFLHKILHAYGDGLKIIANQVSISLSNLTKVIDDFKGKTCNPVDLIDDFVLGTLQMLLIGKISENHERRREFKTYIRDLNHGLNKVINSGFSYPFLMFPFLRFTSLPAARNFRKCIEKRDGMLKFLDSFMEDSEEHTGVYQVMLTALKEEKNKEWLSEENVKALLALNVVFGGYITTRNMIVSLVRILLSAAEFQRGMQDEVDAVIGRDRLPTPADRHGMPYTESVILEGLRYISHVPLSGPHSTSEDMTFNGYEIPKGTVIFPNIWTAHHSEKEWKNPFEFDPSRFLDTEGKLHPADHPVRKQLLNFGIGKRSCIGEVFAKTRIFLFISTLMQRYSIAPVNDQIPPMLDLYDMLPLAVQQPPDYKCRFVKRH